MISKLMITCFDLNYLICATFLCAGLCLTVLYHSLPVEDKTGLAGFLLQWFEVKQIPPCYSLITSVCHCLIADRKCNSLTLG